MKHVIAVATLLFMFCGVGQTTQFKGEVPETIDAVMVGDRLVDVALNLGILPKAMAVRASMWPQAEELALASQILGCPNFVTNKKPETLAACMLERGVTRVIIERSESFCLYKPNVNPMAAADLVLDVPGVSIEYVDFTQGVEPAILQMAELLGVPEKGRELADEYARNMQALNESLPDEGLGKRVLILNGTYSSETGNAFVRVEAPGGYSDQYILGPLGCENVGNELISETMEVSKGHAGIGRITGLDQANPDVIVATGDSLAVQMALREAIARKPELADVPAIKNGAVFSLPFYGDSSVVEYPGIFKQWRTALEE